MTLPTVAEFFDHELLHSSYDSVVNFRVADDAPSLAGFAFAGFELRFDQSQDLLAGIEQVGGDG